MVVLEAVEIVLQTVYRLDGRGFEAAMMALLPMDWFRVTWPFILASLVMASSAMYATLVRGFIVVMGRRPTSHAGCESEEAAAPAAAAEAIVNLLNTRHGSVDKTRNCTNYDLNAETCTRRLKLVFQTWIKREKAREKRGI